MEDPSHSGSVTRQKGELSGVKTLPAASECAGEEWMCGWLPCDRDPGPTGQEAETLDSVRAGAEYQVQEEQKGDYGGRLFYRVKKQAHCPTSPCDPQAAGLDPDASSPHKTYGNKEGKGSQEIPWWGMLQPSEPGGHTSQGGAASPPGTGQARAQRMTKNLLAWAKDPQ